ncbi:MAG TPA: hypothetical protein P5567_00475 [Kiritimatiellia bacterium]|nr:hypothetical protein [Kiritimatiellia bacterium]HRZ10909.1 hypothetical protein [Kiritimatiellia bacterium]HSA18818.1 hypothetical protein [Kiritimatiellia bacterium]
MRRGRIIAGSGLAWLALAWAACASTNIAYIGGDPDLWNLAEIQTALADLAPSPIPDLNAFIAALHDYADSDRFAYGGTDAERLDRISAEPVPMINEVIVSNTFRLVQAGTNTLLEHFLHLTVETWFPFPADPANPEFQVAYSGALVCQVMPIAITNPLALQSSPPAIQHEGHDYKLSTFTFSHATPVNGPGQPVYPPPVIGVRVILEDSIQAQYLGTAVDRVWRGWPATCFQVIGPAPLLVVGGPSMPFGPPAGCSANDPRINWNPALSVHWSSAVATPGQPNVTLSGPSNSVGFMFAATNGIISVAELTNVLYDAAKPWTTVTLVDPDPDETWRIRNQLTVNERFPLVADAGPHGQVSPLQTNVLSGEDAAFLITPDLYYTLDSLWTNGGAAGADLGTGVHEFVWSSVLFTGAFHAVFAEVRAANFGTPYPWLAEHGFTTDMEAAELLTGSNGMPVWQSYVAGLDPHDPDAQFEIRSLAGEGLLFDTATGRLYAVDGESNLAEQAWAASLTNDMPGTGGPVQVPVEPSAGGVYRLRVREP